MADRRRIVTIAANAAPVTVLDIEDGLAYRSERDTFAVAPGEVAAQMADSPRRLGGSRRIADRFPNGHITWAAQVIGATADAALANAEALFSVLRAPRSDLYFEWRPEGAAYSTYFDLRGSAKLTPTYRWIVFAQNKMWKVLVEIEVGPLVLYDSMDVLDDFSQDRLADYTFDSGAAAQVAVTGGKLTSVSSPTVEKRMIHTARGYAPLDVQCTLKATPGSTITGFKAGCVWRRTAANNYMECYVDDDGVNSRLRFDHIIAGVRTNDATVNLGARVANGVAFWVRFRVEWYTVTLEYFTAQPTPMGTPTTTLAGGTLTSSFMGVFPSGPSGIVWTPQQAAATLDDFEIEPYTYRNRQLPEVIYLQGPIPGTAPALADVEVTPSGGAGAAPSFAHLGWTPRPPIFNMCWNGDFEEDTNGWTVAAITSIQGAGTSITRDTTAARNKYGAANGQIVLPATSGTGASFLIYRRFKQGVPYTAMLWASSAAATTSMQLFIGVAGNRTGSTAVALTTTPTLYTATWTPNVDMDLVYITFASAAATATTCNIDGVIAYEAGVAGGGGAGTPPAATLGRHLEGAGAPPPAGIIDCVNLDTGDQVPAFPSASWIATSSALARSGWFLHCGDATGFTTFVGSWYVDPNLLTADDFSAGEIDVEFLLRYRLNNRLLTPYAILSARPEWGLGFGAERFTAEYGSVGKLLATPNSAVDVSRITRLGTLTFPVDASRPARWKVFLTSTLGAGSTSTYEWDYLVCAPVRKRACGATGKPNDSGYPDFVSTTAETTRTVTSDLRGLVAKPPFPAQPTGGAMGGSPIELAPGSTDVEVKLSSLVPDDPTVDATTEQLVQPATVHFVVRPRGYLVRSG